MEYLVRSIQSAKGIIWPSESLLRKFIYVAIAGVFLITAPFIFNKLRGFFAKNEIAFSRFVEDNGKLYKISTGESSTAGILKAASIDVMPEDRIHVSVVHYDFLKHGGIGKKITIERAPRIVVKADGKETLMASWSGTVGEFLNEKGIPLQNLDYSIPGPETRITSNMNLFIKRVKEEETVERIVTEPKTVLNYEASLGFFDKRVDQDAQKGITDKKFFVRTEDSEIVKKKFLGSTAVQQLKNHIVSRGARFSRSYADNGAKWYSGIQSSKCGYSSYTAAVGYGLRDVPKCSKLRVMNVRTGRSVDVMVTDTCNCNTGGRTTMIDLSRNAFMVIHNSKADGNIGGIVPEIRVQLVP